MVGLDLIIVFLLTVLTVNSFQPHDIIKVDITYSSHPHHVKPVKKPIRGPA